MSSMCLLQEVLKSHILHIYGGIYNRVLHSAIKSKEKLRSAFELMKDSHTSALRAS